MELRQRMRRGDQPIKWQPMGQKNIPVWKAMMRVVWQSTDGTIANELKEYSRFG